MPAGEAPDIFGGRFFVYHMVCNAINSQALESFAPQSVCDSAEGFESPLLRQICRVKKLSPQKASVFKPYKALSLKSERALHFSYIRGFSPN